MYMKRWGAVKLAAKQIKRGKLLFVGKCFEKVATCSLSSAIGPYIILIQQNSALKKGEL